MKKVKQNYANTVRRRFQLKQKFALIAKKAGWGNKVVCCGGYSYNPVDCHIWRKRRK